MAEDIDEQLAAYQEELERQRLIEQRQKEAKDRGMAGRAAKQQIKKAVGKAAGKAAEAGARAAGTAIMSAAGSLAAAIAPFAIPILIVILVIVLILAIVFATLIVLCNPNDFTGNLATVSKVASAVGLIGADYCAPFAGLSGALSAVDQFDGGRSGGGGAGRDFPSEVVNCVEPPPRITMECEDCIDMRIQGIPVKAPPPPGSTDGSNSYASRGMAAKVSELLAINDTFIVTEAWCPVVRHSSPEHYNGQAVDIRLRDDLRFTAEAPALVRQLYEDAQSVGFSEVLCEYDEIPGITCRKFDTSVGDHIHLEE